MSRAKRETPSPAEAVGDAARAELRALAEVLNGPAAPIAELPFTLQAETRRESKREAAARQPSIF